MTEPSFTIGIEEEYCSSTSRPATWSPIPPKTCWPKGLPGPTVA